ncbi:MAG: T9SS type A sorting domain-containing protein, partial [Bacteroidota bacterium]
PRLKSQSLSTPMSATIFPNPSSNRSWLNLAIRHKSSLEITVIDAIGRHVYQQSIVDLIAGEHRLELPSDEWSDGHYNVMVQAMNEDGVVLKRNLRLQKRP